MGSKWWQEHWEAKVDIILKSYHINIFSPQWWQQTYEYESDDIEDNLPKIKQVFLGRRFSVSRLTILFSIYVFVIWLSIFGYTVYQSFAKTQLLLPILCLTAIFFVLMFHSKGQDRN